ncbi:MAG: hypothetical protein KY464_16415 [Gemmatimonadetes bacterium]|nr:hypothetical protein [Gemmatimonadota bacterium]
MKTSFGSLLATLTLLAGCTGQEPLSPSAARLASSGYDGTARTVEGEVGGAQYALFAPDGWNGELVLYAHGFRDASSPVNLRNQDGFYAVRDELLARGYAFAYSSFSENGLATKEGARQTHQLAGIFTSEFDRPARTYLMGHSLGGVIAVSLAEQHPNQYAGALAMCSQLGGIQATADYFAHVRVLFDYFYPGVLAGDALTIPASFDLNADVVMPAVQAMQANPTGAGIIARIMTAQGTPIPAVSGPQLVQSIVTALAFGYRAVPDLLDRTHGHSPFDNGATVYTSPVLPQSILDPINAGVDRFTATPDALNYLRHYYDPTGRISVPVLTLSNRLDPVSAPFHQATYTGLAAAAGASDLLMQRSSVNLYGHCNLTTSEMVQAFMDLAAWASTGTKPGV